MNETNSVNLKVGDKVVWNKEGIQHITMSYRHFNLIFKNVVYGIVTAPDSGNVITVNWFNHKGMIIKKNWLTRIEHIDFYEGS